MPLNKETKPVILNEFSIFCLWLKKNLFFSFNTLILHEDNKANDWLTGFYGISTHLGLFYTYR